MSAPTKVVRVHKDAPETSVVPVDAYLVNEDGTPFTGGGSDSSGTAVDAYTKAEADGRFAAKFDLDGKLSSVTVLSGRGIIGDGTDAFPLQLSMMSPLRVNEMQMLTVASATEDQIGAVTLKQITDTVADKLTAAAIETVSGDSVADVKDALNKLITVLTSK